MACLYTIHLQELSKNGDKKTFEIGSLSSTDCITKLYNKLSEQCLILCRNGSEMCNPSGVHILWDTGFSHKKTAKENPSALHFANQEPKKMWTPK